ncbi:MAG: hemolysin [Clostridiales bacterium]|nr:hemolysin [Clostridiales bacterium]
MKELKKKGVKDPGSALTHFIGMLLAFFAAVPLLIKAHEQSKPIYGISFFIFISSMFLLYTASTLYHTFDLSPRINRILKKCDHMMIFVMIAGSYTPICLIVLGGKAGILLLVLIWTIAIVGMFLKAFFVYCPKWVSSVIYIAMGWSCVISFTSILNALPKAAFLWLLAGGVIYTIGGVIYALKLPLFNTRHQYFGSHEVFHVFVLAGSVCHFILMYQFVSVL